MKKSIKKIGMCIFCVLLLCSCKSKEAKGKEIVFELSLGRYEEARTLTQKYFKAGTPELSGYMLAIDGVESERYAKRYLLVEPGWTWSRDGNYYIVKGRVRNYGDRIVRYFEVTIDFYNKSGDVIDSDYTNSGQDLAPGAMKSFEIMHQYASDFKSASCSVAKALLK